MNAGESALDLAARRLERAVETLQQRLAERPERPDRPEPSESADLFADDRAQLAAELDRSRAREKALEAAGAEASEALGRAILEIRTALDGQTVAQEH
jgi:hypothetical protein